METQVEELENDSDLTDSDDDDNGSTFFQTHHSFHTIHKRIKKHKLFHTNKSKGNNKLNMKEVILLDNIWIHYWFIL